MKRRAARVDANQREIVQALRQCGASVAITSAVGNGFPDLVVAAPGGATVLVEIKDGTKPPSARRLTPAEEEFRSSWCGRWTLVESVDEAVALVARLRA